MATTTERAADCEQAVLGALLHDNAADIAGIRATDFEKREHRLVFTAIRRLEAKDIPADIITVTEDLRAAGELEAAGGPGAIAALTSSVPTAANCRFYAQQVREAAERRRLRELGRWITEAAGNGTTPAEITAEAAYRLAEADNAHLNRPRFTFTHAADIQLTDHDWLIRGYIERGTLNELFGDSNTTKTFLALDMTFCVSAGIDWQGHMTQQGTVFYICAEGQHGIKRRLIGLTKKYRVPLEDNPILVSLSAVNLTDDAFMQQVHSAIEIASEEHGAPHLIVLDTWARNLGGADENSTQDTGAAIAAADRLRERWNAAILFIHHTGHADKTRARGAGAKRGALDAEFRLDKDEHGVIRLECTKMKDAAFPEPLAFRLEEVEVGRNSEGEPITTAYLTPTDYTPAPARGKGGRGKWQQLALQILADLTNQHRKNREEKGHDPDSARVRADDWQKACIDQNMPRQRFPEVKTALINSGKVQYEHGFVKLTPT